MTLVRHSIAATHGSIACLAMAFAITASAHASPIAAGGGLEYSHGAGDELTRTGHAFVGGQFAKATLTAAGARYDNSFAGAGNIGIAGIAIPIAGSASWQAWASRFVGDETFRAWRVKTGPRWNTDGGRVLALSYVGWDDNLGGRANGGLAEVGVPIVPTLSAQFTGGYAAIGDRPDASQAAVGLAWTPRSAVELTGDVGLARNGTIGTSFAPAGSNRGPLGLPILGDPLAEEPAASTDGGSVTDFTFTLGMRVSFP